MLENYTNTNQPLPVKAYNFIANIEFEPDTLGIVREQNDSLRATQGKNGETIPDVTHGTFFGENLKRVIKAFSK